MDSQIDTLLTTINTRIAALDANVTREKQLLQALAQETSTNQQQIEAINPRIEELENASSGISPGDIEAKLSAIAQELDTLRTKARRIQENTTRAQLNLAAYSDQLAGYQQQHTLLLQIVDLAKQPPSIPSVPQAAPIPTMNITYTAALVIGAIILLIVAQAVSDYFAQHLLLNLGAELAGAALILTLVGYLWRK